MKCFSDPVLAQLVDIYMCHLASKNRCGLIQHQEPIYKKAYHNMKTNQVIVELGMTKWHIKDPSILPNVYIAFLCNDWRWCIVMIYWYAVIGVL